MREHLYTDLFPIKPHILSITPSLAMFRHTVTVKPFIVSLYLFLRFSNFISHFLSQSYTKKLMTESYGDLSVELLRFCSLYLKYNVLFLSFLASPLVLLLHPVNASELKLGDRRYRLLTGCDRRTVDKVFFRGRFAPQFLFFCECPLPDE